MQYARRLFATAGAVISVAYIGTQSAVTPKDSFANDDEMPRSISYLNRAKRLIESSLERSRSHILKALATRDVYNAQPVKPWNWNWDDREPQRTSNEDQRDTSHTGAGGDVPNHRAGVKRTPTRHLIFIRHGQYHFADDDDDCHLTQLGREQLSYTGERLKQLQFPYKILHYSTMTRAMESAEQILNHLETVRAEPTDLLREGPPYFLEPPLPNYRPSQSQIDECGKRIESAFRKFVHRADSTETEDTYEVYVCHANVIRYIVCRSLQFPPEAWIRFSLDHGSITWIAVRPDGRVSLRWLGNSGHIPPEKLSI